VSELAAELIAWLSVYTYAVAALAVLLGALGVPLPSTVVLLAAGSFVADDGPNIFVLFGIVVVSAVAGDLACFSLARWAGMRVLGRYGARVGVTAERVAAAERRFERWGGLLILVTRFLLTGLALPTNLAAGGGGYPFLRFLGFALVGEAIWAAQLLTLGWLFGPGWVSLLDYLGDTVTTLTALALAGGLVYLLVRVVRSSAAPTGDAAA
jgi:membrane-associated protein